MTLSQCRPESRAPDAYREFLCKCPLVIALSLFLLTVATAGQRGLPPTEGIANFGKVNESLYRGAQPDGAALKTLQRLGIRTIINLRLTDEAWQAEEAEARANGLNYTNVPMHGLGRPTEEQVSTVLSLIETLPSPVFVHCAYGCDRTGTIVACYRLKYDRWTIESALAEAKQYGMSPLERGMKNFIVQFGKRLSKERAAAQPAPADGS